MILGVRDKGAKKNNMGGKKAVHEMFSNWI